MKLGDFKTRVELHDLGEYNSKWKGIYSPLYDEAFVRKYIHDQFLDNSAIYIEKYQSFSGWAGNLRSAQRFFPFKPADELHIIDIGSGSGNTVFPLLDCYPNAQIVASDLSLPLLKSLKDYYDANYHSNNCYIVQLNAEDMIFEPESIDLIVGGAILHHLFDPYKTLLECYKTLKPGGVAVFFEPFEIGNQIVSIIFDQLIQLDDMHSKISSSKANGSLFRGKFFGKKSSNTQIESIPPNVKDFLRAWSLDLKARQGTDKSDPKYQNMDDKWLFTKTYFEEMKKNLGFRELIIFPLVTNFAHLFYEQINTYLRIVFGTGISILPSWAIDHINRLEEHFSYELRQDLMTEGGIVFIK